MNLTQWWKLGGQPKRQKVRQGIGWFVGSFVFDASVFIRCLLLKHLKILFAKLPIVTIAKKQDDWIPLISAVRPHFCDHFSLFASWITVEKACPSGLTEQG
jgi:hypothetical protein